MKERKRQRYNSVNVDLVKYVEENIFPKYSVGDEGHGLSHIKYVINRSLYFAVNQEEYVNLNMIFAAAAYHDIARSYAKIDTKTGRDNHHELGAKAFLADKNMRRFFSCSQMRVIADAIFDHRASSKHPPRSIYGRILSTADRFTSIKGVILSTYFYRTYKNFSPEKIIVDSYMYLCKKYGEDGYGVNKVFVYDEKYDKFLNDLKRLLRDKEKFHKVYMEAIKKYI